MFFKKTIINFNHLKEVEQKYWPHCIFAVKTGFYLILTGFISIIHVYCPLKLQEILLKSILLLVKEKIIIRKY